MPRKQPAVPIRRHYSRDLKQRVIYSAYTLHKKSTEIAIDLDMPLRVVQRVKKTWNEIGEVCRDRRFIGRHPLLSPDQTRVSTRHYWIILPVDAVVHAFWIQYMLGLVEHSPDIYLDEIQEQLLEQH